MNQQDFRFFIGLDWGTSSHRVCVLDAQGQRLQSWEWKHDSEALREGLGRLAELARPEQIAVAVESPSSPVTEQLLQWGLAVFSINPKQLDRFRDRYFPSGVKDDSRDAQVLAACLRTDLASFRALRESDPRLQQLRALVRMNEQLKADRLVYCNRLRDLLLPSFPLLQQLCSGMDEPWVWELLEIGPSAPQAARLSRKRLESLLRRHRIRRISADELYTLLRRPCMPLPEASFRQCARQVQLLLPILREFHKQQQAVAEQVQQLMEEMMAAENGEPRPGQRRDVTILCSIKGVGSNVAATLLAEGYQALNDRDYYALRALAGCAPITRQSGKTRLVARRQHCNHRLREALYHWSRVAMIHDPLCHQHYTRLRSKGHTHGRALRGLADRLLKMLCAMLKAQTVYDSSLRVAQAA